MSEREIGVTREEFGDLARRVESLETLMREEIRRQQAERSAATSPPVKDPVFVSASPPGQRSTIEERESSNDPTRRSGEEPALHIESVDPAAASVSSADSTVADPPSEPNSPPPSSSDPPSETSDAPLNPGLTGGTDWERLIGTQWVEKVGAFILVLGVAFFLKYAFDRGWISPELRIGLGVATGIFFLLAGETSIRRGYASYANALSAIGLVTCYLSIYAGSAL
ncbi:MAG: DUF2339 domain-containing protein, partial [Armatimonadetes bacterium]|nr:DUF2339 domain-containing protein [Armatimonadota bacterium]